MSSHLIHSLQTPKKILGWFSGYMSMSHGIGGLGECALVKEVTLLLLLLLIYVENPDRNRATGDGTTPTFKFEYLTSGSKSDLDVSK